MGKLIRMNGVDGHLITPQMRNSQKEVNSDFSMLKFIRIVIFSPFLLIFWAYKLLIKFPNYRSFNSHIIGLFRACFWGYMFWVPNHQELFRNLFISPQWQLAYPLFTLITFILTVISLLVFLGLSKDGLSNAPIHDDADETNIGFTVRQVDWRLSNQTQRNKFIDRLFKD